MARAPAISSVTSLLNRNAVKGPGRYTHSLNTSIFEDDYQFSAVKGKTPTLSLSTRMTLLEERIAQMEAANQWWREWKESRRPKTLEIASPANPEIDSAVIQVNQVV